MIKYCLACYILCKGKRSNGRMHPCCNKCWTKHVGEIAVERIFSVIER